MINVEEWFMIREFARQGLSITDIAQRVGCDRKTVRKYLADPEQSSSQHPLHPCGMKPTLSRGDDLEE